MIGTTEKPREAARDLKEEFRRGSPDDVEHAAAALGASAVDRMSERADQAGRRSGGTGTAGMTGMSGAAPSRPQGRFGRLMDEAQGVWREVKGARREAQRAIAATKSEAREVQDAQGSSRDPVRSPRGPADRE